MKREPVGNEHERDAWLASTLTRLPVADANACLDAETLAAWADGGLTSQSASAAELHVSSCPRCTALLGALGRTAPAVPERHAWRSRRLLRWLVPLTAAATAIAIRVAVPDQTVTPASTALSQDVELKAESDAVAERAMPQGRSLPDNQEPNSANRNLGNRNAAPAPAQDQFQAREELTRADASSLEATAGAAAPQAPPPAAEPSARAFSADMRKETVAQRAAAESVSSTNALIRWRIAAPDAVERSTDGGKTWSRTTAPASNAAAVRAVDENRAVVTTADNAVFYTTTAGASWTRVQENSTAPF